LCSSQPRDQDSSQSRVQASRIPPLSITTLTFFVGEGTPGAPPIVIQSRCLFSPGRPTALEHVQALGAEPNCPPGSKISTPTSRRSARRRPTGQPDCLRWRSPSRRRWAGTTRLSSRSSGLGARDPPEAVPWDRRPPELTLPSNAAQTSRACPELPELPELPGTRRLPSTVRPNCKEKCTNGQTHTAPVARRSDPNANAAQSLMKLPNQSKNVSVKHYRASFGLFLRQTTTTRSVGRRLLGLAPCNRIQSGPLDLDRIRAVVGTNHLRTRELVYLRQKCSRIHRMERPPADTFDRRLYQGKTAREPYTCNDFGKSQRGPVKATFTALASARVPLPDELQST